MAAKRTMKRKRMFKKKRPVAKNVKKYVKAVINRDVETKEFVYQVANGSTAGFGTPITYNLNYHGVAQSTTETTFIGNAYKMKTIQAQFTLTNRDNSLGVTTTATSPVYWKIGIVLNKTYATTTSLPSGSLYDNNFSLSGQPDAYFKDTTICQWVCQKTIRIDPLSNSTTNINTKTATIYKKFDKTFKYRDFDINYEGKNGNYYLVAIAFCPYNQSVASKMFFTMSYNLKFQDA